MVTILLNLRNARKNLAKTLGTFTVLLKNYRIVCEFSEENKEHH
jgi:hypothetical protein